MAGSFLEVEATFAVTPNLASPDLTAIPGVAAVAHTTEYRLSAVYYDTPDLRLTDAKITLRRRTGGGDDGWHIKLPGEHGRIELRAPLGEPDAGNFVIPAELLRHVRAHVRHAELVPIAQVDNNRFESVVVDANGTPVAEFCDDHVTAWSFLPGGEKQQWREWEFELAESLAAQPGGPELLRNAATVFVAAGARLSDSPSKLLSALGPSRSAIARRPLFAGVAPTAPEYALFQALKVNRDTLIDADLGARRGERGALPRMRRATRQLRTLLRSLDGSVGGEDYERITQELAELATILGRAHDTENVAQRVAALLAADEAAIDEAARERLTSGLRGQYERAQRHVAAAMDSDRYLSLLEALDRFLSEPPLIAPGAAPTTDAEGTAAPGDAAPDAATEEAAGQPATHTPPTAPDSSQHSAAVPGAEPGPAAAPQGITDRTWKQLSRAYRTADKRYAAAIAEWDDAQRPLSEREHNYRDLRTALAQLTAATAAVEATTNLSTDKLQQATAAALACLNLFHEATLTRDTLAAQAQRARRSGEDTFAYGVLSEREHHAAVTAIRDAPAAMKKVRSRFKKLRKAHRKRG